LISQFYQLVTQNIISWYHVVISWSAKTMLSAVNMILSTDNMMLSTDIMVLSTDNMVLSTDNMVLSAYNIFCYQVITITRCYLITCYQVITRCYLITCYQVITRCYLITCYQFFFLENFTPSSITHYMLLEPRPRSWERRWSCQHQAAYQSNQTWDTNHLYPYPDPTFQTSPGPDLIVTYISSPSV
jgi:hypothetical protein